MAPICSGLRPVARVALEVEALKVLQALGHEIPLSAGPHWVCPGRREQVPPAQLVRLANCHHPRLHDRSNH